MAPLASLAVKVKRDSLDLRVPPVTEELQESLVIRELSVHLDVLALLDKLELWDSLVVLDQQVA